MHKHFQFRCVYPLFATPHHFSGSTDTPKFKVHICTLPYSSTASVGAQMHHNSKFIYAPFTTLTDPASVKTHPNSRCIFPPFPTRSPHFTGCTNTPQFQVLKCSPSHTPPNSLGVETRLSYSLRTCTLSYAPSMR